MYHLFIDTSRCKSSTKRVGFCYQFGLGADFGLSFASEVSQFMLAKYLESHLLGQTRAYECTLPKLRCPFSLVLIPTLAFLIGVGNR